ncbi:PH domain-containing protein [Shewanella algae]|uniref:YdbS-like PH domain-containing protein n=1 Tax=Shewanella algae TaxID=38313 RepID=A0AAD1NPI2_9GAMM|nr:PH domain-containing protein [Shewanella algae]MBO2596656.1 PH domain-containing protein [Shewanella algae]MBO2668016.1 PH domain-containing protein [Shewanella algae]BCV46516.1 hypothetical protein TUM17379_35340 [Shewanella algae]
MSQVQQANWHSLSPWAIISFSLTSLKHFLSNGYALVPILYTGWQQGFDSVWLPLALALTLVVIFAHGLLSWRKFRYRLTRGQLEVHSGALFKRKVELPIDRIQNVRLEQPFYFKPLRLGNLIVETAGSAKDEACLSAVTQAQAESLRQQLMKRADTDESAPTSAPPNSRLLVKKSLAELALFGLYQNNFVWFAVIAGPVLSQLEGSQLMELGLTQVFDWHQQQLSGNLLLELGFLVGLLLLGYLLFSLISIVAALLKYAPYRLTQELETLQRSGGLLSHQQDILKQHRIQLISLQQPLLARWLKRWTLSFKQVKGNEVEGGSNNHMLVPSLGRGEVHRLLKRLNQRSSKADRIPNRWHPIHPSWFYHRALWCLTPATLTWAFTGSAAETWLLLLAGVLAVLALYLRYRQWGFWRVENDLWIHKGLLGHSWQLVSLSKVQHLQLIQSRGQKRRGLASLKLGLASGELTLPAIPLAKAQDIAAQTLGLIAHDHSNWI